mmetsp:Transcript_45621/g.102640  ORF Transcript_45621/g.102640 Transcript_45621/m.102640 type:complete len:232 (-) Transcript_45621:128-823(-)
MDPDRAGPGDAALVWSQTRMDWVSSTVVDASGGHFTVEYDLPSRGRCRKSLPAASAHLHLPIAEECDPGAPELPLQIFDGKSARREAEREEHLREFRYSQLRKEGRLAELQALQAKDWRLGELDPRRQDDKTPFAVESLTEGFGNAGSAAAALGRGPAGDEAAGAGSVLDGPTPRRSAADCNLIARGGARRLPLSWYSFSDQGIHASAGGGQLADALGLDQPRRRAQGAMG